MHGRQWRARRISFPGSDPDETHGGIDTAPHPCLLNARMQEIESRGLLLPSIRSASEKYREKTGGRRSDVDRACGHERSGEDFQRAEGADYPWMSFRDVIAMP